MTMSGSKAVRNVTGSFFSQHGEAMAEQQLQQTCSSRRPVLPTSEVDVEASIAEASVIALKDCPDILLNRC